MSSEKGGRKDKNQNIQVFVRLRPLNQREKDIKSLGVIEVVNNREVVVRQSQQTNLTKKFTFDKAFGPSTKQVEVYQDVVSPLIEEVLAGYNCTVFAYGQTGTGKTHTMVGENTGNETTWQNDPLAGIIPRALSQLFDELRISNTEYTVRVSYLELYNEELFDLLSTSEDNSKLRIYEDVTRKGSNIVNGLEEITVYNKNEVYKIMDQGQDRKKVASTLMNAQSSRSHTVFTIVVHMKENSPEGEELVKIGKLNLVDLAGSENISKAGSDNPAKRERARECVNINQSLLTLGRVITALVERHPHIPYRESKLTRILQESLGGRTKTSIIATISPGHKDLEETMSTLEYAHRAKNIQNKPEVNQKMTKKAILKEYAEEIDRLKRDLQAARDKSGVYLANETYAEMTLKEEEQRKEIQALLLKKKAMEDERDRMVSVFEGLHQQIQTKEQELNNTKNKLDNTKVELVNTSNLLKSTKLHFEEQQHLVSKQRETEHKLASQARELLAAADMASTHVASLHDTVDRRKTVESTNLQVTRTFRDESSQQRSEMGLQVQQFSSSLVQTLNGLLATLDNYSNNTTAIQEQNRNKIEELTKRIVETMTEIKTVMTSQAQSELAASVDKQRAQLVAALDSHSSNVASAVDGLLSAVCGCVQRAAGCDAAGEVNRAVQQWYSGATDRVSALRRAHDAFTSRAQQTENKRMEAARKQRDVRRQHAAKRTNIINACIAKIEEKKALMESRLTQKLTDIETERRETEARLKQWMEEQQRLLEDRLHKKTMEIEEEKKHFEERIAEHIEWQKMLLEADEEELTIAEADLEESETGKGMLMKDISGYGKEFEEGTSSISIDMEWFSRNVVEIMEHIYGQLMQTLNQANTQIQSDSHAALEANKMSCDTLRANTCATLDDVTRSTRAVVDSVVLKVEENNTSTIEELTLLATSSKELAASTRAHLATQSATLSGAHEAVAQFEVTHRQALERHADLEGRYLTQEYRTYSPSGSTPARSEYRYPRLLAATSPHERILARYRAMRQNSNDDDCIVVEPENENRTASDSESSTSEDSAVVFVAPSPPIDKRAFFKSTSETDIYIKNRQEQPGKENANRSISNSYKKPSRLPAPSSHKKPLVDRNEVN